MFGLKQDYSEADAYLYLLSITMIERLTDYSPQELFDIWWHANAHATKLQNKTDNYTIELLDKVDNVILTIECITEAFAE